LAVNRVEQEIQHDLTLSLMDGEAKSPLFQDLFVRAGKRFRHYFVGVRPHGMDGPEAARRVGTKTSRFAVLRRTRTLKLISPEK
jgi:hypothetical protein